MRDLSLAKRAHIVFADAFARARDDPHANFLAVFCRILVWRAEGLHGLNLRMAKQEFLDLARVDVFAAANQHVFQADDDIAVSPSSSSVARSAGVHPAIDAGFARFGVFAPLAFHHRVTARAEFARLAVEYGLA